MINSHTELNNKIYAVLTQQNQRHHSAEGRIVLGDSRNNRMMRAGPLTISSGRGRHPGSDSIYVMCRDREDTEHTVSPSNVFLAQGANYRGLIDSIGNTNEFLWYTHSHPYSHRRFIVMRCEEENQDEGFGLVCVCVCFYHPWPGWIAWLMLTS